jgi:predicted ATPase
MLGVFPKPRADVGNPRVVRERAALHPFRMPALDLKVQKRRRPVAPLRCHRVVLTGGPGGGKTTAADLFRREIGDRAVIVPEAATILFQGGFPRSKEPHALRAAQTTIFHLQRNLEDVQDALFPGRTLLCDRGTIDGAAYWPGPPEEYFRAVGTTLDLELKRYDAVIFFESAAVAGSSIEGGNPVRNESLAEAVRLDGKLRKLWEGHPKFILVSHNPSFFKKISFGLAALEGVVAQLNGARDVAEALAAAHPMTKAKPKAGGKHRSRRRAR